MPEIDDDNHFLFMKKPPPCDRPDDEFFPKPVPKYLAPSTPIVEEKKPRVVEYSLNSAVLNAVKTISTVLNMTDDAALNDEQTHFTFDENGLRPSLENGAILYLPNSPSQVKPASGRFVSLGAFSVKDGITGAQEDDLTKASVFGVATSTLMRYPQQMNAFFERLNPSAKTVVYFDSAVIEVTCMAGKKKVLINPDILARADIWIGSGEFKRSPLFQEERRAFPLSAANWQRDKDIFRGMDGKRLIVIMPGQSDICLLKGPFQEYFHGFPTENGFGRGQSERAVYAAALVYAAKGDVTRNTICDFGHMCTAVAYAAGKAGTSVLNQTRISSVKKRYHYKGRHNYTMPSLLGGGSLKM